MASLANLRVIVRTECKARGQFSYTKPNLAEALDVFFVGADPDTFFDRDGEEPMTRADAEISFGDGGEVTFYNSEEEATTIVTDPSAH